MKSQDWCNLPFYLCIKQTYVYVCMLIEVVETVSLRYIHCLE